MISVATDLAARVDFVRVDIYETNNGIKFGELTNYPGGGIEKFVPESLDEALGTTWVQNY